MLGYELKNEQEESVFRFASGKDCVCLPVMASHCAMKSCPSFLTSYVVWRRSLVVSPLSALMKDQVAAVSSLGIAAAYVTASSNKKDIQAGKVQFNFDTQWRRLLCTDLYRANLIAFVVNEAHCIKDW